MTPRSRSGNRRARRIVHTACLLALLAPVIAAEQPLEPLPPLPPDPRPLAVDPEHGESAVRRSESRPVDRAGLVADITAMTRARERVRSLLAAGEIAGIQAPATPLPTLRSTPAEARAEGAELAEKIESKRLGNNQLAVKRWLDGSAWVTASIDNMRVEVVYRELMSLLGRSVDDQRLASTQRMVSLHVEDLRWQEALTRLLGQVSLAWREGGDQKIVIYDLNDGSRSQEELRRLAERAFGNAARDLDNPYSAEAIYRMAAHEHRLARLGKDGGRYWTAMERYLDVIENYDRNSAAYAPARPWVRRAIRGYADALRELGQYRDSRGVYLNYISKADDNDPSLPEVYYAAAEASRQLAMESRQEGRPDPASLSQATDLLQVLLTRFADDPHAAEVVTKARLDLGNLLYDRGDYRAARAYLQEHLARSGEEGDEWRFKIAECDFQLALRRRSEQLYAESDALLARAQANYQALYERLRRDRVDPLADKDIYRTSAFRIGECHLYRSRPDYVKALFAFLRAQKRFREGTIDGDLLVHIARCYSELQAHDQLVEQLYEVLKTDRLADARSSDIQIEQFLADILGQLNAYPDSVRTKVLFHIAQANFHAAERDPLRRAARLRSAIHEYQRVIDGNTLPALRRAARVGLARAALAAGDETRGVQALKEILRAHADKRPNRDVALAAQLLGDHYRAKGDLERAIHAYRAEIDGGRE